MKAYKVKEAFYTLQGEGLRAGRAAVFCRFSGCNLWSGHEKDRPTAACQFCDTDFVGTDGEGGGRFVGPEALADHVWGLWPGGGAPYLVFTGGEPMLQLDEALVRACQARGFEVAIETNGTHAVPACVDWICVSPKPNSVVVQTHGHELKLVWPQAAFASPEVFVDWAFEHRLLQPLDDAQQADNVALCTRYCLSDPRWRLSLQTHKIVGLP